MRKKYLSALLFGALLFASAGTFTSCKDYDDDINGLREDVTSLQNAVTTLQNAVENGKYVSAVSNNGNTITFTFTDGTTTDITLEDEKGSVVTVNADGVLCIDGEPTDIKAATDPTPGEEQKDQIIIENNMWSVLQEDGTYKSTGIPVSGINVAGSEADGYTFTIYAADGSSQTVKLPSAASAITEMTLGREVINGLASSYSWNGTALTSLLPSDVLISHVEFDHDKLKANAATHSEFTNFKASDWKGNKKLPNDGDFIYSSPTKIDLRMDPVDVPANNLQFYLTNTKNEDLEPVVLAASASQDSNNGPMGTEDINSRAAVTGNGLWTLSMANQTVAKDDNEDVWDIIENAETNKVNNDDPNSPANPYVYALNANHGFRSEYKLTVKRIDPEKLTYLTMKGVNPEGTTKREFTTNDNNAGTNDLNGSYDTGNVTFKVGTAYKVNANAASALYDMYLTADDSDVEVYGLTFDQDAHTFTIGKNPDVSTVPANFDLIVYTVANDGTVNKATITVQINTEISAAAEYGLHEHDVNKDDNVNYFSIDLATMKTALGDNLNQWIQNVDLSLTEIKMSEKEDMSNATTLQGIDAALSSGSYGIQASVVEALTKKDDSNKHKATTDRNKANFIQIDVENKYVNGLKLDKTYYIQATFYTPATTTGGSKQILNSIIVPVEFHAPKLADLFTKKSLYVVDDVINAYFYKVEGVIADGYKYKKDALTVNLDRYFSAFVADAKVKFADGNVGETGKKAANLFAWNTLDYNNEASTADNNFKDTDSDGTKDTRYFATVDASNTVTHSTTLGFNTTDNGGKNNGIINHKPANGYGEALTIEVNKDFYNNIYGTTAGWLYTQDGDNEYSFQIRLMSPIYEGGVRPVTGTAITIQANDLAKGASITSDMISGYDYNNVPFSAVPDDANGHEKPEVIYDESMSTSDAGYVSAKDYKHAQIETVIPSVDKDNYIQYVEIYSAYDNKGTTVPGEFKVYGTSTSVTGTVNMPVTVTDAWGYVLEDEVPITIQKN